MAPLFILSESSAGYLLLKATDKHLLQDPDLPKLSADIKATKSAFKLKTFAKFENASSAVSEAAAIGEGKVTPMLAGVLDRLKEEKKASLIVADPKLATAIAKLPKLSINAISDSTTMDVFRAIREHLPELVPGLLPNDVNTMSLGLSHSLSRHKLKFSPDKVDTMIVQAINLLDDLDKELNQYAMRVKEWYGWHFPEMAKVINDNLAYARLIRKVGMRSNMSSTDLSDILPEDLEAAVKAASEVSMGTEITEEDLETIQSLATQVDELTTYRALLASYLSSRMQALAPNLTQLVGELVGARLIAHAGSLQNLAKSAGSTIQILGAEKALFRALKTKHDTPKYGLIFHASLVGQASGKNKGKIARMLAAKAALGVRVDSMDTGKDENGDDLPEDERSALGIRGRRYLEKRLALLEGRPITGKAVEIRGEVKPSGGKFEVKEIRKYNVTADGVKSAKVDKDAMEIDATNGAEDSDDDSDSDSDEEEAAADSEEEEEEEEEDSDVEEKVQTQLAAETANGTAASSSNLSKKEKKALKKALKKGGQASGLEDKSLGEKRKESREAKKQRRLEREERRTLKRELRKKAKQLKDAKKREKHKAEMEEHKKRKRDVDGADGVEKKKKKAKVDG
jgi:nucleolar protein 58